MELQQYQDQLKKICFRNPLEVFKELEKSLKPSSKAYGDLILLKNQASSTSNDHRLSLITNDDNQVYRSKIINGLVGLINNLENEEIRYFDPTEDLDIDLFISKMTEEDEANSLLNTILSEQIDEEYQKMALDKIRYKRFKNKVKIFSKAKKLIIKSGLPIKTIPLKMLSPLIDYSSLEENESLQNKWSKLIASLATLNEDNFIYKNYIETLNNLSPIEAKFLDDIYDRLNSMIKSNIRNKIAFTDNSINEDFMLMKSESITFHRDFSYLGRNKFIILDNLIRLGLIRWDLPDISGRTEGVYSGGSDVSFDIGEIDSFRVTDFGLRFIYTCKNDDEQEVDK